MEKIIIKGNKELSGTIKISGSKNSAVALIPASLLCDEPVKIDNVPNISDIDALNNILKFLGAKIDYNGSSISIDNSNIENKEMPEEMIKKLRASYYFMSSLLGRFKKVTMYFPGGCSIGSRPIDQTLKGYRALGAIVEEKDNKFTIYADELIGGNVYLDMPSVGATINTILVAVKAKGTTIIDNAAKEPEIVNLASFLNSMGANIKGAGTSKIIINGVKKLYSGYTEVIPDRIEAGTYVILGSIIGNKLKIDNIIPEHIETLLSKIKESGINVEINTDNVIISKSNNLKPISIKTLGYPGFPTDLQQPLTAFLLTCNGKSTIEETIYEDRFKNVYFLNKMGANIKLITNRKIEVYGPSKLTGTDVEATDLRAGACMILASLLADGTSTITNIAHVLRGYENIVEKLKAVGADIELIND